MNLWISQKRTCNFLHFKPRCSTKYHNVTLIARGRSAIDLLCEAGPDAPEMAEPLKPYDKRTLRRGIRGIRGIWDKRTLHTALQCKQVSPLSRPDSKQRQVRYQSEAECIVVLQRLAKTLHLCESLLCSSNWLYRPEKKFETQKLRFSNLHFVIVWSVSTWCQLGCPHLPRLLQEEVASFWAWSRGGSC